MARSEDDSLVRVTRDDVARAAGVSGYTVSQALAGKRGVSEVVAQRVRAVAERMGYRPNPAAALLAGQRRTNQRRVPVALHREGRGFERQALVEQMEEEFGLELHPFRFREYPSAAAAERVLWSRGIRGIVLGSDHPRVNREFLNNFNWGRFSVVQGMRHTSELRGHVVRHSAFEYMKRALQEVLQRGYKRISVILMETASKEDDYAREAALLAFRTSQAPNGITCRWHLNAGNVRLDAATADWIRASKHDALIVFQWSMIYDLLAMGLWCPGSVGLAAVYADQGPEADVPRVSGGDAGSDDLTREKLRLVRDLVLHGETGFPKRPIIRVIEPEWIEGETLPTIA